jgi:hypothetical protein
LKAIQNYSINVVVLENFNDIVPAQTRSKVIEALMIQYLIQDTDDGAGTVTSDNLDPFEKVIDDG